MWIVRVVKRILAASPGAGRWRLAVSLAAGVLVVTAFGSGQAGAGDFPVDAIGRLVIDDAGICTAFVVRSIETPVTRSGLAGLGYENWLVSAGHCARQKLMFVQRGTAYPVDAILGFSSGGHQGHDVMVAVFVTERPMPTLEPAFGNYPPIGDKLVLIGYGRNALMIRAGPVIGYDGRGHLMIENFASPGNSGGPVLLPGTRRVVGIGIETTLDLQPGLPAFLCHFGGCGVKPPYYATHNDRLLGVVSFR